ARTLAPAVRVSCMLSAHTGRQAHTTIPTRRASDLGFDITDVSVTGGTLGPITKVNDTTYTATFTPTAGVDTQTASIQVLASGTGTAAWTDKPGKRDNASNTLSVNEDTLAPAVPVTG